LGGAGPQLRLRLPALGEGRVDRPERFLQLVLAVGLAVIAHGGTPAVAQADAGRQSGAAASVRLRARERGCTRNHQGDAERTHEGEATVPADPARKKPQPSSRTTTLERTASLGT